MNSNIIPLNKRKRPLNLFDLKITGSEYTNCIDELIESKINMGQICLPENEQYVQIIYVLQKIEEKFHRCDYFNSKILLCQTKKTRRDLINFLGPKLYAKVVNKNNYFEIFFENSRDACFFLQKSNLDFQFYRPKEFIEVGDIDYHLFVRGCKYNKNLVCSKNKMVIGPINVNELDLRDNLDFLLALNGFRRCNNLNLSYFIFEFQIEAVETVIRTLSHLTLVDGENENELIIQSLYKNTFIFDFNMINNFESRNLAGPIITSIQRTKILQILNLISPDDLNEKYLKDLKNQIFNLCSKYGNMREIIIPFLELKSNVNSGFRKIFVECDSIEDSEKIYKNIGGEIINNRVLICSYFPEFNYLIHEFE
ncbi:Splicing factor U2AF 50 kDa subunit [Dictyocoela muelleri]|nr:Splicing factor U2AF 50 kDa subunit [Dictyocoela muelleri]